MKIQMLHALLCTVTMRGSKTATHKDTECSNNIPDMKNQILFALLCTVTIRGSKTATHSDTECSNNILDQMFCKETHHKMYVNHGENLMLNFNCYEDYYSQLLGPNKISGPNTGIFMPYIQGKTLNQILNKSKYRLFSEHDSNKCSLQITSFISDDDGIYKCLYLDQSTIYINVFDISAKHKSTMNMRHDSLPGTGYLKDTSTDVGKSRKTEMYTYESKHMDQGDYPEKKSLAIWWMLPLVLIIITIVAVATVLLKRRIAKKEQKQRIEDIEDDFQGNLVENNMYQMSSFLALHNEQEHDEAVSASQIHADNEDRHSNVRNTPQVSGHHLKGILSQGAHAQINEFNMNYADVMFDVKSATRNIVIHGNDERTIYSEIDHAIKAEPLPSSSSESEED